MTVPTTDESVADEATLFISPVKVGCEIIPYCSECQGSKAAALRYGILVSRSSSEG